MDQEIIQYIVDAAIRDIRNDIDAISEENLKMFSKIPVITEFRKRIAIEHEELVLDLLNSDNTTRIYLGAHLVNAIQSLPSIRERLISLWWEKDEKYDVRGVVMYPLLNYKLIEEEDRSKESEGTKELRKIHKSIFEFVKDNWEKWTVEYYGYIGGKDKLRQYITKRLEEPEFPISKRWVYLIVLKLVNDQMFVNNIYKSLTYYESDIEDEIFEEILGLRKLKA